MKWHTVMSLFVVFTITISEMYAISNTIEKKTMLTEKDKRGTSLKQNSALETEETPAESRRRHLWNRGSSNRYYSDNRPGPPYPSSYEPSGSYGYGGYIPSGPSSYGHSGSYDDRYGLYSGNYRPSGYGPSYGSNYGPPYGPSSDSGYIEPHYIPEHGVQEEGGIHKALALKKLLIPLAGLAILGAAAVASSNPVLLQLGVVNGRKRRSLPPPGVYPVNPKVMPQKSIINLM